MASEPGRPPAETSRMSLLVMSRAGVLTFPLPDSGEVTIGRAADCHVRVDDAKASRCHARLRLGASVQIVDQRSANGTFVDGRRLEPEEPADLMVGAMATVGSTVLVLQRAAAHGPVRVWTQAAFEARVEEERVRARSATTGYAVARVSFDRESLVDPSKSTRAHATADVARAEQLDRALRSTLRATDVIGTFAPGVYHVLLVETDADVATRTGAALERALRDDGFEASVDVQCFDPVRARSEPPPLAARDDDADDLPPASAHEIATPLDDATIARIAASVINVLVLGETGVGKEVMARRLHQRSARADAPLLCLNCAALSESLLESELFGFEKGAFTGATQSKPGLLESAQGGTVFLDEVGEMPMALQAKLLRVLEQREVLRVGALRPRPIDVRFVSATNRDLESEIAAGRFRRDLYFRLNGISVTIPPLRERVHEVEPLARAFVAAACAQSRRGDVPDVAPAAMALLRRYAWPGNIRELRNVMERAVVLCTGGVIGVEHLPAHKMASAASLGGARGSVGPEGFPAQEPGTLPGLDEKLADLYGVDPRRERARILAALTQCGGNQTEAAKVLGISRRTLVTKLGQLDLPRPRKKIER